MFDEGACCPRCVEDWVTADPAEYTDVPLSSDLTIRCSGLVPANTVDWFFSNDDGETWTEIDRDVNRMTYTIKKITAENDGKRKIRFNTLVYSYLYNNFSQNQKGFGCISAAVLLILSPKELI